LPQHHPRARALLLLQIQEALRQLQAFAFFSVFAGARYSTYFFKKKVTLFPY
jgi:hypothetical protein